MMTEDDQLPILFVSIAKHHNGGIGVDACVGMFSALMRARVLKMKFSHLKPMHPIMK